MFIRGIKGFAVFQENFKEICCPRISAAPHWPELTRIQPICPRRQELRREGVEIRRDQFKSGRQVAQLESHYLRSVLIQNYD